uniref:Uncharacterized protein n=1 Tax=Leersia perrieri TaxID=77586 RepID=A0A0D9XRP4_9ORYZ
MSPPRLIPFLLLLLCVSAADRRTNVSTLPGLDAPLPSHIETGYVTVDEEHGAELFYYFIESEGDPSADPPYDGVSLPRLRRHPYSWTRFANILFVDSPVGAGFSFSRDPKGYDVGDVSSTLQLVEFVNKWFTDHGEFRANPFYVDIEVGGNPVVNLKGYLVGNPGTGDSIDFDSKVPYGHGVGIISDQLYEMILEHCGREDYNNPKNAICAQALNRFNDLMGEVEGAHILYKKCAYVSPKPDDDTTGRKILMEELVEQNRRPARPPMDCVTYPNYLSYFWANNNITREMLGIEKGTVDEWVRCDDDKLLPYSTDTGSIIMYHRNLTSRGYRVLVYSGDHDSLVPFLGTQAWIRLLNYPIVDNWRAWHVNGQSAGFTITYGTNLTFATGGGHTAPEYQPERCFEMRLGRARSPGQLPSQEKGVKQTGR